MTHNPAFDSCLSKQANIKALFAKCKTVEERYEQIIRLGRTQPTMAPEHKKADQLVQGCQSQMYLYSYSKEGKVYFESDSDALISKGLGALLIAVYSGESPEVIMQCPPTYLEELDIAASLTPNRANGLYSLHLRMKQEALKYLTK